MKSAGWYFMKGGQRVFADTKAEIRRLALKIANETGKPVTVREAARPKPRPTAKAKPRTMRRNPDPASLIDVLYQLERGKAARREHGAKTKPVRLAKADRRPGRTPGAATRSAGRRFAIDVKNRKESYSLYRPTRAAADQLAGQFQAAGYTVVVREV